MYYLSVYWNLYATAHGQAPTGHEGWSLLPLKHDVHVSGVPTALVFNIDQANFEVAGINICHHTADIVGVCRGNSSILKTVWRS